MKVVYVKEQKQAAIKTYKKLKSYEKTLRVLSYPSRHVFYDWVNKRDHENLAAIPIGLQSSILGSKNTK